MGKTTDEVLEEREHLQSTSRATKAALGKHLLEFIPVVSPEYAAPVHLSKWCDAIESVLQGGVRALCMVPIRHNKPIACNTPILTANRGWVQAGEIRRRDRIPGSSGKFVTVNHVFRRPSSKLYRVRFTDTSFLDAGADHLWQVHHWDRTHSWVATTEDLIDLVEKYNRRSPKSKVRIPMVKPVSGHNKPLPLDPYVLGVWLGDGTTRVASITTMDREIIRSIQKAGFEIGFRHNRGKATTYGINGLRARLMQLGLMGRGPGRKGKSWGVKFVPEIYLRAAPDVRLAVLQGLADTDGSVAQNGSQQSICTTSARLRDDIEEIVYSLGGKTTIYAYNPPMQTGMKNKPKTAYVISFRLPAGFVGFRLKRKLSKLRPVSNRNKPRRFVKSVTSIGVGDAVCFEVDAPDHLFCAGKGFVVTHNSETSFHGMAWLLARDPTIRILVMLRDHDLATERAKRIKEICEAVGIETAKNHGVTASWKTPQGGGVTCMSAQQTRLGLDVDVLVFDDPLSEHDAADPKVREQVDRAIRHYTMRAGRPGRRGSVLGIMSPWHPDDPMGRRIARQTVEWNVIRSPAIRYFSAEGIEVAEDKGYARREAFAPSVMDLAELDTRRAEEREADPTERLWYAQFQCDPKPDVLGLFRPKEFRRYLALPTAPGFRTVFGVDLEYSSSLSADYFALVVLRIWPETQIESGGRYVTREVAYVVAVWRERWDPARAAEIIKMAKGMYPGGVAYSYMSGPEIGTLHYMTNVGVHINYMPARYNKRVRAQRTIDLCNAPDLRNPGGGRVLFPDAAPWLNGLLARMGLFSGDPKAGDDDEVDALVSAIDGGMAASVTAPRSLGKRRI